MSGADEYDPTRVLVVDDDGRMLRTHGRVLAACGLAPVLMVDPGAALEEAKRRMPAVMVVDLVMPGMSGLELVTRLRTHYQRICPPVVLVSAKYLQLSPMEQLMFDAIFSKPYSIDTLAQCVRRFAREHYERHLASSAMWGRCEHEAIREDELER